jgi:hypothetical protein
MKAEQYLKDIMAKHKNRLVYDSVSGEIRDDRKYMTMLEDYWLPRREGGRGTEVDTLPAGANLGEMDDVLYFQKQLYRSLNVPVTRLDSEAMFDLGRATQISRDEIKFSKFIDRLRTKFTKLFLQLLEKQLILKGVATYDDWLLIKDQITFRFARDNYFAELKEQTAVEKKREEVAKTVFGNPDHEVEANDTDAVEDGSEETGEIAPSGGQDPEADVAKLPEVDEPTEEVPEEIPADEPKAEAPEEVPTEA